MWFILGFILFIKISVIENVYISHNLTLNEISNKIIDIIGVTDDYGRIKDLRDKITKVNEYAIENNLFAAVLSNVTKETTLNETNFYEALKENDHFRFLTSNDSTNLYLKLKQRMNRDDILKLLSERGENGSLKNSARRIMENPMTKNRDDEKMNDVVDKILAEVPNDDHKVKANESIYWDPQEELEDLKEYYESKHNTRRIYKGERSTIREYPFMTSIHIMGRFWCGGALYSNDLVITSASCLQLLHNNRFFRENPRVLEVRVGSNHSRIGGETIDALEVYFHPSYEPRTLRCNLAVIRLRRHLTFTYHRIPKLIAISDIPTPVPSTADITVLGWGVKKMTQKLSYEPIYLQKKNLPVYPNTFCKEVYGSKFITEQMFCAGTITTGEGACDHDAGGPAILSGRLVGIISFGPAVCGIANVPTVFTLIGAFSDWIETINENMPGYYQGRVSTTTTPKSLLNDFFVTWKSPIHAEDEQVVKSSLRPVFHDLTSEPVTESVETVVPITTEADTTTVELETVPALRNILPEDGWSIESRE